MSSNSLSTKMRLYHRYLGFFLVGIMSVYACSGIVLIFRDSDTFKIEREISKTIATQLEGEALGKALRIRRFKADRVEGGIVHFKQGTYNQSTGEANYKVKELPYLLDKMTHLHKAKSADPLFFLNIFFGLSLLFFVISSLWMFTPKSPIFKKGMYFVLGGIALTLALLFI